MCGDAFGSGSVEAAWCSGHGLASALISQQAAVPVTASLLDVQPDDALWTADDTPPGRPLPAGARAPHATMQATR